MMIDMKLSGADTVLVTLKSLPPTLVSKNGGPVLRGLRKGARVIRDQEVANLRNYIEGSELSTGLLIKSIVVSRGKAPIGGKGERVLVRIRRKTYPGTGRGTNAKAVTTTQVAFLFEYGSEKQPGRSFIVAAAKARATQAIAVATAEVVRAVNAIVRKLSRPAPSPGARR